MSVKLLIVDDEKNQRHIMSTFLEQSGYLTVQASSGEDALEKLTENSFDAVVSDMKMKRISGLDLLREIRKTNTIIPFIMVTAFGNVESAVEVMKMGAADYITKPVNLQELLAKLKNAIQFRLVVEENDSLRNEILQQRSGISVVTESNRMKEIISIAGRSARADVPVLVLGESGTGKELIARTIHDLSPRKNNPFIPVNCASLNPGVLESELFGHEKGSFTGAHSSRVGRFEMAHKGTLFLDEVGDIPHETQVKLLRVLEENVIERVGGGRKIPVDFRLVCATNRDLDGLIADGKFREDLLYRINVVTLNLPPLRERREDIPLLLEYFVKEFSAKMGMKVRGFSEDTYRNLINYAYPGNIRELKNIVQRAIVLSRGDIIECSSFESSNATKEESSNFMHMEMPEAVEALEKQMIISAMKSHSHIQVKAAESLGISERNLRYKIKKYSLEGIKGD